MSDALRAFMNDFGGESIFSDLFGFEGGRGQRRGSRRGGGGGGMKGSDLQVRIPLTIQEINDGVSKTLKVRRKDTCPACKGSGSKSGQKTSCGQCGGRGRVQRVANSFFGQVVQESICPACSGEGNVVKDPCHECGGSGRFSTETTISVDIPAGVAEGNYIPVQGKGDAGLHGGPSGDLIVLIEEKEDEFFKRHGIDVVCEVDISFSEAALGSAKTIPTLNGKVSLKIPAGTQSGKIFRLRQKGLPALHSSERGDQLIKVNVKTPEKLSREERELFEKLVELETKPKNVFERARDMFV
jgi:molecular chaperone DnaJ